MLRSANPALREQVFTGFGEQVGERSMSLQGTVNRTLVLLGCVAAGAVWTWQLFVTGGPAAAVPWAIGGAIGGLVLGLVTGWVRTCAPYTAIPYALAEGLFLGFLSALMEQRFPGVVMQGVAATVCTLAALLVAYSSGFVKATENFKLGLCAATGGIFLVYLATWVLGFFGMQIPYIHSSGLVGIGFSVFVIVIAALNLVLDFDFIESGVERGAPKSMEWYGAFGLIVTLVWLYVEFLRLLSKLNGRNR